MQKMILPALLAAAASAAIASEPSGSWKFERIVDYHGDTKGVPPPKTQVIQIVGERVGLASNCNGKIRKDRYFFSRVFQPLVKEGVSEQEVGSFLSKQLNFKLDNEVGYFKTVKDASCDEQFSNALLADDTLLLPYAGTSFYTYRRSNGGVEAGNASDARYFGHTPSQLPFRLGSYLSLCADQLAADGKLLEKSPSCGPVYQPAVARKASTNKLDQLVGSHNYKKLGASHADDYAPPFASNLRPVYLVLPALKDVLLVRVDDFEAGPGGKRDVMSGAWLAVKGGQVTDQINEGCDFDDQYVCSVDGKNIYQLTDAGKFKRLRSN